MTKRQENEAFVKMLNEFPKVFGRVSFRERLMLRAAFSYVVEEVIADIIANCDLAIEGRNVKIMELERKLEQTEKDLADYQFNYPTIKELEEENEQLRNNGFTVSAMTEQQLKVAIEKGEQLEKENRTLEGCLLAEQEHTQMLEKENKKLQRACKRWFDQARENKKEVIKMTSVADYQQSCNMKRYFEIQELKKKNKELDVFLNVGSTFNKTLNSTNKALEEERDKYRNMVFDQKDQLTKAKELLTKWVELFKPKGGNIPPTPIQVDTEQFISEIEK